MTAATDARERELAQRLDALETRVVAACQAAGRPRDDVTVIAVTKRFPVDDLDTLVRLGVRDVGENLDQEASAKAAQMAQRDLVRVHFVGQLQSNKARHVATYADVVHSLDRSRLLTPLSRGAAEHGREVGVLIQVSLDGDPARGGSASDEVPRLAQEVADTEHLRLRGVMAVAPLGADPAAAFARLHEVSQGLRERHPEAWWISAGMSGDLEAAVAQGATHLRVGAAILGSRASRR